MHASRRARLSCKKETTEYNDTAHAQMASSKRAGVLAWDDYFLAVAFLSAQRSKDPNTQVGACVVDADNHIVGVGYNGFPRGISDDALPWARAVPEGGSELDTKYPFVCHAEMNAILNLNTGSAKGCRIFVALFPCNKCAQLIIQAGIVEVVFVADKYHDRPDFIASRRMLDLAGVPCRQHVPATRTITIDFEAIQ